MEEEYINRYLKNIKDNIKTIVKKVMANTTYTLLIPNIKANSNQINTMDKDNWYHIIIDIKDNGVKAKSKVEE